MSNQELAEDNIISRARDQGLRILMFGDETWLKLFPSAFTRYAAFFSERKNKAASAPIRPSTCSLQLCYPMLQGHPPGTPSPPLLHFHSLYFH